MCGVFVSQPPTVLMPDGRHVQWITEDGVSCPVSVQCVDDSLSAKRAVQYLRDGVFLVWTGDFHHARSLLKAIQRRIRPREDGVKKDITTRWLGHRARHSQLAEITGRFLLLIEPDGSLANGRAPKTRQAVQWAWGLSTCARLVPYRTLMGAMGAAGWRRAGLSVEGLSGSITPHYGVFAPTRDRYVSLLNVWGSFDGCRVLDVGCGTGVLSFVLLQRGASFAVGTDMEPRSVACATENALNLGFSERFTAIQADLFPPGERFDRILFNAPWVPVAPATRLDRAVFDEGGKTLCRWLEGVSERLNPLGEAGLILSDLPERLGLRTADWLQEKIRSSGLRIVGEHSLAARHGKSTNRDDPFYEVRKDEQIYLYRLAPQE